MYPPGRGFDRGNCPFAGVTGLSLSEQSHFMSTRRTETPFDAPSVARKGFVGHPCPTIPGVVCDC